MATDRLPNSTQMADAVTALQTIAQKTQTPYNASNKLPTDYADDTNQTHKFATQAQLDQINTNKNNISLLERLNGKKNYFNNKAVSKTVGTLTFTVNDDKSITVSGSNSTSSAIVLYLSSLTFEYIPNNNIGKYLIGITDGSGSTYRLGIVYSNDGTSYASEAYQTTSPYKIANNPYYEIQLSIASGYAFSEPKTFYPMIIDEATLNAGFTDYQPYALSNAELTTKEKQNEYNISINKNELIELVDSGDKNIIDNSLVDGSQSGGVTATVSTDKQVTLSGSTTSSDAVFATSTNVIIPAGTYIGSGCPTGGATDKYRIDYIINDSTVYRDTGSSVEFTVADGDVIRSQIVVYRGNTAPSTAFAPMVCLKPAYTVSPTYQPHKGYDIINGRRIYVADTAPTGTIPTGAIWIGG